MTHGGGQSHNLLENYIVWDNLMTCCDKSRLNINTAPFPTLIGFQDDSLPCTYVRFYSIIEH